MIQSSQMNKFFIEKDNQLIFNGVYMEVYIPKSYFENNIATILGNRVKTLGIFDFKIFNSIDGKSTDKSRNLYKCPLEIVMQPSSIEKGQTIVKNLEIDEEDETDDNVENVVTLKFYKNDIFILNEVIEQNVSSVNTLVKLLNSGKINKSVDYKEIINLLLDNLEANNFNLKTPSLDLELIISELYRQKKDTTKPYRMIAGKTGKVNKDEYVPTSVKKISTNNSTFTAISGENIRMALISSVNKTQQDKPEKESPVEKVMKY